MAGGVDGHIGEHVDPQSRRRAGYQDQLKAFVGIGDIFKDTLKLRLQDFETREFGASEAGDFIESDRLLDARLPNGLAQCRARGSLPPPAFGIFHERYAHRRLRRHQYDILPVWQSELRTVDEPPRVRVRNSRQ